MISGQRVLRNVLKRFKKYSHQDCIMRYESVRPVYPPPGNNLRIPGIIIYNIQFYIRNNNKNRRSYCRRIYEKNRIWMFSLCRIF